VVEGERAVPDPSRADKVEWCVVGWFSCCRRSSAAAKTIWSAANADGLIMAVGIDAAGNATVAWAGRQGTNPAIWVGRIDAQTDTTTPFVQVVAAGTGGRS
jgi:hypothetical protein